MNSLICALMLLGLVSLVGAHSGNSDPNVVHACVRSNKLTKIVSPTSSCAKGERSKHWSIKGPAGLQGPQGPAGPQGPQGPAGPLYVLYDGSTRIGPALEVRSTSVLVFHEKLGVELRVSPNGQVFATGGSYNLWYLEPNCAGTAHVFKNDIIKDWFGCRSATDLVLLEFFALG